MAKKTEERYCIPTIKDINLLAKRLNLSQRKVLFLKRLRQLVKRQRSEWQDQNRPYTWAGHKILAGDLFSLSTVQKYLKEFREKKIIWSGVVEILGADFHVNGFIFPSNKYRWSENIK